MAGMDVNPYESPEPNADCPKRQRRSVPTWIPALVANVCYTVSGLVLFALIGWLFGPETLVRFMLFVGFVVFAIWGVLARLPAD